MAHNKTSLCSEYNAAELVILDHRTGARLSRELVEMIAAELGPIYVSEMEDSAIVGLSGEWLAITTDSFVV